MGSRLLDDDDDDRDPDDPDAPAVLPRKPKASALKKLAGDAPKASSSLDDFITKANEGLLDVRSDATPIPTSSREKELQAKLDELEKKLATAEARAKKTEAAEPVMPMAPPSRGWGGIVVAFVLGCGVMFGVNTLLMKKDTAKTAATTPPPEPTKVAAPDPAPAPTPSPPPAPIETTQPTQVAQPTPAPTPAPDPTPAPQVAAKKNGGAKHTTATHTTTTPTTTTTTTTPKPADGAQNGSSDLYNPF